MRAKAIILLLSLFMIRCSGQPGGASINDDSIPPAKARFVKALGDSDPQEAFAMIETRDGSYVMLGYTTNYGTGGSNLKGKHEMFMVKLNASGKISWARTIGHYDTFDLGLGIVQSSDGGYLLTGGTDGSGAVRIDIIVTKLDAAGNHQWSKIIGGANEEMGYSVIQAPDGSYVLTGRTQSFGAGKTDLMLTKLDSNGNLQWTYSIGGPSDDFNSYYGPPLILTSDNKLIVAGSTTSFGAGKDDTIICKLDLDGKLLWAKTLGRPGYDRADSVVEAADGGYLLAGSTDSYSERVNRILLSKFSADGTHIWTKTLGGPDRAYAARTVVRSSAGGYAVAGLCGQLKIKAGDFFVSIFDKADNLVSATILPMGDPSRTLNYTKCFVYSSSGGYYLSGETTVPYMPRAPFVKLDSLGETCGSTPIKPLLEDQTSTVVVADQTSSISIARQNPRVMPADPKVKKISPAISTVCADDKFKNLESPNPARSTP